METKTQFKNQTGSHMGAAIIDATGKEKGIAVEPHGTVWLSEAEQRLTAQAPRRAEDNPFDPRSGAPYGLEGPIFEAVSEARPIASDRLVPAEASSPQNTAAAKLAATGDEPQGLKPATPVEASSRAADWDQRADTDTRTTPDDADPLAAGQAITTAATTPGPGASAAPEEPPTKPVTSDEDKALSTPEVTAVDQSYSSTAQSGLPTAPPPPEVLAGQEQVGTPEAQQTGEELSAAAKPSAAFTGTQEDVGTPEAAAQERDEDDGDNLFPGS